MSTPTIFQAFIGPAWLPVDQRPRLGLEPQQRFHAGLRHRHADHGTHQPADDHVHINLPMNNANFSLPPKGGIWIGPANPKNQPNQAFEYIGYNLADDHGDRHLGRRRLPLLRQLGTDRPRPRTKHHPRAQRRPQRRRPGATSGRPSTPTTASCTSREEMDPALASSVWVAELSGVLAPRALIRTNHALYIRTSDASHDHYEHDWTPFMLGWIDQFEIQEDYQHLATWKLRITSIAGILNRLRCPTVRIGDLDLATSGRVIKSATILAHPCKERDSGDYIAANPDLTAKSLIDGKEDTLCIFERTFGAPARDYDEEHDLYGDYYVGAGCITPNPELGKGYRWLQIYKVGGDHLWDIWLCQSNKDQSAFVKMNGSADATAASSSSKTSTSSWPSIPWPNPPASVTSAPASSTT